MSVAVVDAGPQQISRSVEVQAPAAELFAIVADPTRHHEVDGSGTVRGNIRAPAKFGVGARFSTRSRRCHRRAPASPRLSTTATPVG